MTLYSRNLLRWVLTLATGFAIGTVAAMTDQHASFTDYLRHGALALVPTLVALKTTLEKELGIQNSK